MTFHHLSDQELIDSARHAIERSREAEVDVLRHFREIEERRLWVEVGSLYQFLTRTFHLTADQFILGSRRCGSCALFPR